MEAPIPIEHVTFGLTTHICALHMNLSESVDLQGVHGQGRIDFSLSKKNIGWILPINCG